MIIRMSYEARQTGRANAEIRRLNARIASHKKRRRVRTSICGRMNSRFI